MGECKRNLASGPQMFLLSTWRWLGIRKLPDQFIEGIGIRWTGKID